MKKIQILFKSMILATLLVAVACGGNQPKGDKAAVDYDKLTYPQLMEQASAESILALLPLPIPSDNATINLRSSILITE